MNDYHSIPSKVYRTVLLFHIFQNPERYSTRKYIAKPTERRKCLCATVKSLSKVTSIPIYTCQSNLNGYIKGSFKTVKTAKLLLNTFIICISDQ